MGLNEVFTLQMLIAQLIKINFAGAVVFVHKVYKLEFWHEIFSMPHRYSVTGEVLKNQLERQDAR